MVRTPGFRALMYHEIVPTGEIPEAGRTIDVHQRYADLLPAPLFLDASTFRTQMETLAREGYECLTLGQVKSFFAGETALPDRSILLTFDDLYQSVREYAFPVLLELGLHATGFVVSDWIFPEPSERTHELSRTLSWPELEAMRDVFEYANHSAALHTREEHGTALERAPRDLLVADTARAGLRLDHPDVYAYPFGAYTRQSTEWLADAGVALAFTTVPGYNTETTPRLELRRDAVVSTTTEDAFRALLE